MFFARFLAAVCITPLICLAFVSFVYAQTAATGTVGVSAEVPSAAATSPTPTPTPTSGGGVPSDIQAPIISNIRQVVLSDTEAVLFWQTNEEANTVLWWGVDEVGAPLMEVRDPVRTLVHEVPLSGLVPCTGYRYEIHATDAHGNEAIANERVLSLPCDVTPPLEFDVQIVDVTDHSAVAVWVTDEPASSMVEYGETATYGNRASLPGFVVLHAVPFAGLFANTLYHVRVRSVDPFGNERVSEDVVFWTGADQTPPSNVGLQAIPGDGSILLWWGPLPEDAVGVRVIRNTMQLPYSAFDGEVLFEGDATSFVDGGLQNGTRYYYGAYAYDAHGNRASGSVASAVPFAESVIGDEGAIRDLVEEGGEELSDILPSEVVPEESLPAPTVSWEPEVSLYGAEGTLGLGVGADGTVGVLTELPVRVEVNGPFPGAVRRVFGILGGISYVGELQDGGYVLEFTAPPVPGVVPLRVIVEFEDGAVAGSETLLRVQAPGRVFIRPLVGPAWRPIPGAVVTLYRFNGARWEEWDGGSYAQQNPRVTDEEGRYAFLVPPGLYFAEVTQQGYMPYRTISTFVDGNVFALSVKLVSIPSSAGAFEESLTFFGRIEFFLRNSASWLSFQWKMGMQFVEQREIGGWVVGFSVIFIIVFFFLFVWRRHQKKREE